MGMRGGQAILKAPFMGEVAFNFTYRRSIRSFIKDDEFGDIPVKKVIIGNMVGTDCYAIGKAVTSHIQSGNTCSVQSE